MFRYGRKWDFGVATPSIDGIDASVKDIRDTAVTVCIFNYGIREQSMNSVHLSSLIR